MTAPQIDAKTDPNSLIALQQRLDAALAEKTALAQEPAARLASKCASSLSY
jgi:hypothetical protein